MKDEEIFELAESNGFQDDFGRWNFTDEELLDFVHELRQALAQTEQEQKTPLKVLNLTVFTENRLRNGRVYDVETLQAMTNRDILAIPDMGKKALAEVLEALNVHAVNMSQERVDKTAKREHEPWPSVQCACGGTIYFKYTPPVSDYHEGWEEGFKAATREQEPFIYVREDNEKPFGGYEHCSEADVGAFPVYSAPPKREWVGIGEKEVAWLWFSMGNREGINGYDFARAIEAKLKEKNT